MGLLDRLQRAAARLKQDALTAYFAARHPDTPLIASVIALVVAAYALSPIDLIPDFIPVLGYLDDLVLLPLGIIFVIRLTPAVVLEESRAQAAELAVRPISRVAAACIVVLWILCMATFGYWQLRKYREASFRDSDRQTAFRYAEETRCVPGCERSFMRPVFG